ncbi:MAG: transposase [Phycisphaerales bacterium JB041]
MDRAHNGFGSPLVRPDVWRETGQRERMGEVSKVVLAPEHQSMVHAAIAGVCEHRGWKLLALAVRSNHVHLVVNAPRQSPESVMQLCKSWVTRRLREVGVCGTQDPVWTRHGSTRYIWNESGLSEALDYVVNQQDNRSRFGDRSEPRA